MNNNWLGTTDCVYSGWRIWQRLSVERESGAESIHLSIYLSIYLSI